MRNIPTLALIALALSCVGCATVTRGTTEAVVFDSEPAGAEMRSLVYNPCSEPHSCIDVNQPNAIVDREHRPGPACTTPCTINVPRSQELIVTFSKAGYAPQTVKLGRKVPGTGAAGVAGNLVLGGVAGLVTDTATGAGTDHDPNPLKVALRPVAAAPAGRTRGR
jgi:hypothetical protein